MRRLAELVLRHRKVVFLIWALLFLAGAFTAKTTVNRLSATFSLPGQPGYETALKTYGAYGNGGFGADDVATITLPSGQATGPGVARAFAALSHVPGARIVDAANTNQPQRFITNDGHTAYALIFTPLPTGFSDKYTPPLQNALHAAAPTGATATITGLNQIASSGSSKNGPSLLAETLVGAAGALAVLAFVFASFLALIPLVIAAVAILTTFLTLLLITTFADVSFIVQFLVGLVGLGVAVDYSLLLVTRWREERAHGRDNHDAVVVAMQTAGHAIVFSGVTVAVGLVALVVLPVPFLRSMGYGGALIPLISVAAACTLLPALLGGIGPRVDWPRIRHENRASRGWTRWASFVVRRRWWAAGAAIATLVLLLLPLSGLKVGLSSVNSLARSGAAFTSYQTLLAGDVPAGILTPMEVLTTQPAAATTLARLQQTPGVAFAGAPTGAAAGPRDGLADLIVIPNVVTENAETLAPVRAVKGNVDGQPGVIGVAGIGPTQIDYVNAVYHNFAWVLAIILVLTFLLLARAFRSLLLPLKAVLLNLISMGATFGAVVFFWQDGHGSDAIYGISPTGAITLWVPIVVFAFLYGLSMDYEVFILSRVREEYDKSGSTTAGVVEGIGRTGRLVTSAALILFLAFLSLSSTPETDVKVLATALGFGILLDATIIRSLLVPALVSLFGRINWVLPAWAARPLRVAPSLPDPEPAPELVSP